MANCQHPVYGRVPLRFERLCFHIELEDGMRASLCYEPATGRWLAGRAVTRGDGGGRN